VKHYFAIVSLLSYVFFGGVYFAKIESYNNPKKIEFCEIVNNPQEYDGREITFVADYRQVFMLGDLLSDPACDDHVIYVSTANDPVSSKIRDKIYAELKDIDGGSTSVGRFKFVGFWRKNPSKSGVPIKGLVQGYTMLIRSAKVIK
jgi:hypothetical protein